MIGKDPSRDLLADHSIHEPATNFARKVIIQ